MNILLKLILPIFIAFLLFAGTVHNYWAPKVYEQSRQDFKQQAKRELSAMEDDLIRNLLANDYSALFSSLDHQLEKNNTRWVNLNLYDDDNQLLYPLFSEDINLEDHPFYIPLSYPIKLEGSAMGRIEVYLNWQVKFQETQSRINELESFLLATAITIFIVVLLIQVKFIRTPLSRLQKFAMDMAQGDFNEQLIIQSNDEFGQLSRAFNTMQKNIMSSELALQEQKYALDQHAIVAITDVEGTITYANDRFCDISGYSQAELVGQNNRMIKSEYHDTAFFTEMYHTISQGNVWHGEICNRAKDNHLYWVDSTIVPFKGKEDKPKSYIAIHTDITSHKKTEIELIQAKNDAEAASQAKSEFLATMSHEIRTPMNGVLGMLGLLLTSKLDKEQRHRAELAQNSANALLALINDILDFSKIEANKLKIETIDFNLRTMLSDFSEAMALQVDEKKLEIILDITNLKHSMIKSDPGRIQQILTNLVGNAIKFTEKGEIVIFVETIATSHSANDLQLHFKVSDTGIGIPAEKLDQLFDSFSQVDASTTRKYGGTGLGLSIAMNLTKLMGGEISVISEEGHGSCFDFTLLVEAGEQSNAVIPHADLSKLHILIVDDNAINREVLRGQLEHWGAMVTEVEDGASAMDICNSLWKKKDKPFFDIAFLDMLMPQMDGAELGQKLKADPNFNVIKLIMMTSINNQGDGKYFSQLGFSAYFPKPATESDLYNALSVISEDGDALKQAQPLVTQHYLKSLGDEKQDESLKRKNSSQPKSSVRQWPKYTRLLLVEDNRVNQLVASGILNNIGLQADIASNGIEALENLQHARDNAPYTVILMDCQMPEMDGYEASRQIRAGSAGERYKSIPIIAMTANAMEGDREKCLEAGMSDYLSKPINLDKVSAKLNQWLLNVE